MPVAPPLQQMVIVEVSRFTLPATATFSNGTRILVHFPKPIRGPGAYEARIWIENANGYGIGNNGHTDIHAELAKGEFAMADGLKVLALNPQGAYRVKLNLDAGQNTLAIRVRTALQDGDVSQVAQFQVGV